MNEPIVNPWLVYLFSRLDVINIIITIVLSVSGIVTIVAIISLLDTDCDEIRSKKWVRRGALATIISLCLGMAIPTKQEAIVIYAASKITPANIQAVGESADKVTDTIVEKIIRMIDAAKEDK